MCHFAKFGCLFGMFFRHAAFVTRSQMLILALVLASISSMPADMAEARPFRGSVEWSVLLCMFSDSSAPPNTPDFYRDMGITPGADGLHDYWQSVSYGGVNLSGSVVKGWYTEPLTIAQAQAKSGGPNPQRGELMQDCIDAARNSPTDPGRGGRSFVSGISVFISAP